MRVLAHVPPAPRAPRVRRGPLAVGGLALVALVALVALAGFAAPARAKGQQVVRHDPRAATSTPAHDAALGRIEAAFARADVEDATFIVGHGDAAPVVFVKGDGGAQRRYHADSAQKWVLATLLLRDARARGVGLDQPLSTWPRAPAWAKGAVGEATLRQLLSFTSGFEDPPACAQVPAGRYAACVPKLVGSKRTTPRRYSYGTHHMYIALAALAGDEPEPTAALLARFQKETGLLPTAKHRGEKPLALDVTPGEYAAFLRALSRHELLHPDDEREMFTNQVKDLAIGASPADAAARRSKHLEGRWRYGFGNWIRCDVGQPCAPHHHSAGARGFYPFIDTDTGLYGLVAHNDRVGDWVDGHMLYESVRADLVLIAK